MAQADNTQDSGAIRFWRFMRNALIALVVLGVGTWWVLLREVPQKGALNDPDWVFNHASIGNETTQGLPYWIWRVLPVVFNEHLPGNRRGYAALGIVWPAGEPVPQGFSLRTIGQIPRVSPTCGFCHQGSYRLDVDDPEVIVTGMPGNRMNVQAFVRFLTAAGNDAKFNARTIMPAIKELYDMPLWERMLYRYLLIPATKKALKAQGADLAWADTRTPWLIGRVDPFNPPKFTFLGLKDDGTTGNSDTMSVWNMKTSDPTVHRRFSVHWDGLQTNLHQTMISGAIGDGLTRQGLPGANDNFDVVSDFIRHMPAPKSPYRSDLDPSDPYFVAEKDVMKGKEIYMGLCADCHEPGGTRFRTPIDITEVGTDRHRMDMWSHDARDAYAAYEDGYYWGFDEFRKSNGYLAFNLDGLWLRGPYLHNGSVPHLRALLMPQDKRPKEFWRGSDLIDPVNGGFVSDNTQDPYRYQMKVDTALPANGNMGHLWGTDLGAADKDALLAYLKTL